MKRKVTTKVIVAQPDYEFIVEERPSVQTEYPTRLFKIRHRGTSIVVAQHSGHLILISQFRPVLNSNTLEFPGGVLETGESPAQAAKREFMEETGIRISRVRLLGSFFASVGTSDEIIHCYSASCTNHKENKAIRLDTAKERLRIPRNSLVEVTPNGLEGLIRKGKIVDAKTALGFFFWKGSLR